MDKLIQPFRFVPYPRPMVWGGRRLRDLLDKVLPTDENYGESWEVSDHPLHPSKVATGPQAGATLRELMRTQQQSLLGQTGWARFPWLIKFLDARDWLSIQVHPDDVKVHDLWPGEVGKTEAWFILDADPGSRIYAGLLPGVEPQDFLEALVRGGVTQLLYSFVPRPGDCLFLPAGTVHGIGGGVLLAEVQQTSDATFRLFDWNRVDPQGKPRTLHIQQGLAAIDWNRGQVQPIHVPDFREPGGPRQQELVDCPYFRLSYLHQTRPFRRAGSGTLEALVLLDGQARVGAEKFARGQVVLLPASLPEVEVIPEPKLTALHCTLPPREGP